MHYGEADVVEDVPLAKRKPFHVVCVDGSEESDAALKYALRNVPFDKGLVLIHGLKIPYWAGMDFRIHSEKEAGIAEHQEMTRRYQRICKEEGRECGIAHFTFSALSTFGDTICGYSRILGAQSVITGRRESLSPLLRYISLQGISDLKNTERMTLGSSSRAILDYCTDVPVTVVGGQRYKVEPEREEH